MRKYSKLEPKFVSGLQARFERFRENHALSSSTSLSLLVDIRAIKHGICSPNTKSWLSQSIIVSSQFPPFQLNSIISPPLPSESQSHTPRSSGLHPTSSCSTRLYNNEYKQSSESPQSFPRQRFDDSIGPRRGSSIARSFSSCCYRWPSRPAVDHVEHRGQVVGLTSLKQKCLDLQVQVGAHL